MGYNEKPKLKFNDPNNQTNKIETTNQQEIWEANKSYQKIYNEHKYVTLSQDEIKKFLQMCDDTFPWQNLSSRRVSRELVESMEGNLTMEELHEALFKW